MCSAKAGWNGVEVGYLAWRKEGRQGCVVGRVTFQMLFVLSDPLQSASYLLSSFAEYKVGLVIDDLL